MTNGNRPPDPRHALGRQIRPSTYTPRRRRNDVIVTGVIGFVVGAIFGLAALGLVALIGYLTTFLIGLVGYVPVVTGVALVAGIGLAILTVRSSK